MLKEWLLIPGLPRISILSMLIICILICGCITNSATDGTNMTVTPNASIPAVISPVPLNVSNQSTLPPMPVKNTSTATPKPLETNKSTIVSSDFAPGLPPAVLFTHVPAYGSTELLKGTVTGADPTKYKLAIFVNSFGWWNVPSGDVRLTNINPDLTWECNITRGGVGKNATRIDAYIVPLDFDVPTVMGRYGIPREVRDIAIADNEVSRKKPSTG